MIAPSDWFVREAAARPFEVKFRPGYAVTWRVEPRYVDTYAAPGWAPDGRGATTTLAEGLPPGRHTLELVAEGPGPLPPLREIRVYRPLRGPLDARAER